MPWCNIHHEEHADDYEGCPFMFLFPTDEYEEDETK